MSFTGSGPVGCAIRDAVPRKHVTLELGGNAAARGLRATSRDATWTGRRSRIATFCNYQAGQSCIAVQRVFVARRLYDRLRCPALVATVEALRTGDPRDEDDRRRPADQRGRRASGSRRGSTRRWRPAPRVLTGGKRDGATYAPTVLDRRARRTPRSCAEEVFGPVLVLSPRVDSTTRRFAAVNDSAYGLQAGVFTHDIQTAFAAHRDWRSAA